MCVSSSISVWICINIDIAYVYESAAKLMFVYNSNKDVAKQVTGGQQILKDSRKRRILDGNERITFFFVYD